MIKTYIKRPVEIQAVQWTGINFDEIREFMESNGKDNYTYENRPGGGIDLYINTLEGVMHASIGDYIIQGVSGEFYPCKPGVFMKTYEEVTSH